MKPSVTGEIICNNMRKNSSLRRFIEKEMTHWIRKGLLDRTSKSIHYLVYFDHRPDPLTGEELVLCELDIIGQSRQWLSHEKGRRAREAFSRCLGGLDPVFQASA